MLPILHIRKLKQYSGSQRCWDGWCFRSWALHWVPCHDQVVRIVTIFWEYQNILLLTLVSIVQQSEMTPEKKIFELFNKIFLKCFLSCLLRSELTEGEGRPGRTSKLRGRLVEVFCSYIHTSGQWMSSIYNVYHTYWWTVEVFYILASGVAAMLSYRFKCCTPFPFELISIAKLPLQYTVT